MQSNRNAKLSSVLTANSVINSGITGSPIQLQNDILAPPANYVYGTTAVGVKGWKPDPAGGSGSSEVIQTTYATFQASSGLATNKLYFITDAGRRGYFQYIGTVTDQALDNTGTTIVNAGLQRFDRVYNGVIDLRWFGIVEDVVTPAGAYAYPTGTDNKAAFDLAVTAAGTTASGAAQKIICEGCRFLINSKLTPFPGTKVVNIEINGSIFLGSGCDTLFQVKNIAGDYDHNRIYVENIVGQGNVPLNGPTARGAGTSPVWTNLTATVLLINNSNKGEYTFNRVWGVKTVVEIYGDAGKGSQENTINGITWYDVANHVLYRSGDGSSFCDKNKIGQQKVLRLSGGLATKFDGGPGNTGAMRSDEHWFLYELIDSLIVSNADVTNPAFYITPEGGSNTGIFSLTPIQITGTFRSPYWGGSGVLGAKVIGGANMGQDGIIEKEIWNVTYKVGDRHFINSDGSVTTVKRNGTISNTNITALQSQFPTWKFTTEDADMEVNVSTTYTVSAYVNWVICTGTSYTVTFPSGNIQRLVTVKNNASGTITVSGVTGVTSIPSGQTMSYRSFQTGGWQSVSNLAGTGGGGGGVTAVVAVGTGNANALEIVGTDIKAHAATSTQPGVVNVGAQVMPTGTKTFDGVGIQGATFLAYNIIGRQNGISWNDVSTPNPSSSTLTAFNFGSGSSSKNIVFGFGKTSVNWAGFGQNGTDLLLLGEKSTGGFEWRNNVGYATMDITAGNLRGKIFGTSGNWLVQSGGTATDAGYKLDVQGTLRATGVVTLPNIAAPAGLVYMATVDENGVLGSLVQPTGGTGGSSIFTAGSGTGSPYYHSTGAVNIGVNPAQSWAWTHWGASCSTCGPSSSARAIWEFASTSVFVASPRLHSVDYNGSYLRLTPGNGVAGRVVTENNGLTIAGSAHFEGADIESQFIDRGTSVDGDIFTSNGVDGSEWRRPYQQLIYTSVTPTLITTTGLTYNTLIGGAKTIPQLLAGDIVVISGSGGMEEGNNCGFRFDILGQQIDINPTNTVAVSPEKNYEYEVKIMSKASGTSAGGSIKISIRVEGEPDDHLFTQDYSSGLNTSGTGTVNVSFRYTTGSTPVFASVDNTIEVKRQIH